MRDAIESEMTGHREQHQKQVNALRDESNEKQSKIDELKE
jgi:hypothetical protein